jgi:hypothetical protein
LPSNDRGIHIQTDRREVFLKYVVEMGSDAVIYIQSFITTGAGIQTLIGGIHKHTDSVLLFKTRKVD